MVDTKPDSGFRFDRHISVGHIFTTAMVATAVVAGYVRLENQSHANARAISDLRTLVAVNRQFQIDQRNRVWERVDDIQERTTELKSAAAALSAKSDYIARQVDRLVDRLIGEAAGGG